MHIEQRAVGREHVERFQFDMLVLAAAAFGFVGNVEHCYVACAVVVGASIVLMVAVMGTAVVAMVMVRLHRIAQQRLDERHVERVVMAIAAVQMYGYAISHQHHRQGQQQSHNNI